MTRILNVGSVNIDHVYKVPHFVQPGETLSSVRLDHFPGGKGLNQSVALAHAGGKVYHAGKVGEDGGALVALLQEAGADVTHIRHDGSTTGHTVIQVTPEGQNCILLHPGANHELQRAELESALAPFGEGDVLVLQNEVNEIAWLMEAAHQKGMRIAFNPSPIGPAIAEYPLHLVRWFLLNEIEGRALTGKADIPDVLSEMARLYPKASIVLTVGKDGVMCHEDGAVYQHGIYDVPVVDTTAAGDTFTGFYIASVAEGKTPEEALRLASVASSIAVSRQGAAVSIPTMAEVRSSTLHHKAQSEVI